MRHRVGSQLFPKCMWLVRLLFNILMDTPASRFWVALPRSIHSSSTALTMATSRSNSKDLKTRRTLRLDGTSTHTPEARLSLSTGRPRRARRSPQKWRNSTFKSETFGISLCSLLPALWLIWKRHGNVKLFPASRQGYRVCCHVATGTPETNTVGSRRRESHQLAQNAYRRW